MIEQPYLSPEDLTINRDIFNQSIFSTYTLTHLNRSIHSITSADFNDDGFTDLAVTGSKNYSKIFIIFSHGDWEFSYKEIFNFNNDIPSITSGDFDNDGDIDIIFTSNENILINSIYYKINGTINFLKNIGGLNFSYSLIAKRSTNQVMDSEGRINPEVSSADFDLDGDLDLLVGDNSGKVELYINDGFGNFLSNGVINDFGANSWGINSNDFDKDGDIDFIVSTHENNTLSIGHIYLKNNKIKESNLIDCFSPGCGQIVADISFIPSVVCLTTFDYENDGDIDILVGSTMLIYVLINENDNYRSIPVGYLLKKTNDSFHSFHNAGIASIDINNDGLMDIIIGGANGYLYLLLNNNKII